eukprot:g1578.t1
MRTLSQDYSKSCLKTELRWLLEDVFYGVKHPVSTVWTPVDFQSLIYTQASDLDDNECLLRLDIDELNSLWRQRIEDRMPIQYLTETVHWRDLILTVIPGVLIPRPETELLIEFANDAIHSNPSLLKHPWVDLGCGSGAIALSLAKQHPKMKVLAIDKSSTCIKCTQVNVKRLDLTDRVSILEGNWYEPLSSWKDGLGGIISNPPYIPSQEIPLLQVEVSEHEPHLALDGGSVHGTESLNTILDQAGVHLVPGGFLALETQGLEQIEQLVNIIKIHRTETQFERVKTHMDYYGVERFLTAVKIGT